MSPFPQVLQFLVVAVAGWINQQQRDVIDYRQEENRVLREQLGPGRLRFTDAQRRRLAAQAQSLECGMHYKTFEQKAGRNDYRVAMNPILGEYSPGYQLTSRGEVVQLGPTILRDLERAPSPPGDPSNVQARVNAAVDKFRRRGASANERRDSIRDLADVLEYLRPQMKEVLASKDEADLFELANRFGIRHHNQAQQTTYDRAIWYSWMFYYYLASIHATTRLIARKQEAPKSSSKKQ